MRRKALKWQGWQGVLVLPIMPSTRTDRLGAIAAPCRPRLGDGLSAGRFWPPSIHTRPGTSRAAPRAAGEMLHARRRALRKHARWLPICKAERLQSSGGDGGGRRLMVSVAPHQAARQIHHPLGAADDQPAARFEGS